MTDDISIVVNGAERRVRPDQSLLDLLATLGLDPRAVVVELNREVVRRERLADQALREGDRIELVHFVGGG
jgi:sulfur carrier protein